MTRETSLKEALKNLMSVFTALIESLYSIYFSSVLLLSKYGKLFQISSPAPWELITFPLLKFG